MTTSRQRLRWIVVGVAVASLVVIQLVGVVLSGIGAENTALSVARDSIRREGDTTIESILRHLEPAEQSVDVTSRLFGDGLLAVSEPDLERYLYTQLAVMPQMTGAFIGFPDGSFTYVNRDDDGYRSKRIEVTGGARDVVIRHRTADFSEVSVERPTDDTFDPRERPWYDLAAEHDTVVWTDPYVFFSSRQPGVTASRAVRDSTGAITAVVGVDVELSGLTEFIDQLLVSEHGEAFVVSGDVVVAAPSRYTRQTEVADDGTLRLLTTDELGIARLVGAGDDRTDVRVVEAGDEAQLVLLAEFPEGPGLAWGLVIRAPQSDFTEAVREQQRSLLLIWLAGAALIAVAAAVMARVTRPVAALHSLATTDPLTGIPNRRAFAEQVQRLVASAEREGTQVAMMVIDLDGFKSLNDGHGHIAGDDALAAVGHALRSLTGRAVVIGRLGGDEFAAVWRVSSEAQAVVDASEVLDGVVRELRAARPEFAELGASAGLSVSDGPEIDCNDLMRRADAALLERKAMGKGSVGVAPGVAAAVPPV